MPEQVRLWRVSSDDVLEEIAPEELDFEARLEKWISADISMLRPDLLVVGRQVSTTHGGVIDLLCLNSDGDCVIVELKRGRTPREVTAQALDYASWVNGLSGENIVELSNAHLGDRGPLEDAFARRFRCELPEVLNAEHSILVVGSEIDPSTERIMRYLSTEHGVHINAVTFQHFRSPNGDELVSRLVLMEQVAAGISSGSKRRRNLAYDELDEIAKQNGVWTLFNRLVGPLTADPRFQRGTTMTSIAFTGDLDGSRKVFFSLIPTRSSQSEGLHFQLYAQRTTRLIGMSEEELFSVLPQDSEDWGYGGYTAPDSTGFSGYFHDETECARLLALLGTAAVALEIAGNTPQ